jgi:superfamily II DNA or RNA helicase
MLKTADVLNEQRPRLMQAYKKLAPTDKVLLQLYSVLYEPVSLTVLGKCLDHLPKKLLPTPITRANLSKQTAQLQSLGFLVGQHKKSDATPLCCHPAIAELITRELVKAKTFPLFVEAITKGDPLMPMWYGGPPRIDNPWRCLRVARCYFYQQDFGSLDTLFEMVQSYSYRFGNELDPLIILQLIINNPFDAAVLETLPTDWQLLCLEDVVINAAVYLAADQTIVNYALDKVQSSTHHRQNLGLSLGELLLLKGELSAAQELIASFDSVWQQSALYGWIALVKGDTAQAIAHFEAGIKGLRKQTSKRTAYFDDMAGVMYVLAVLKSGDLKRMDSLQKILARLKSSDHWLEDVYAALHALLRYQQGDLSVKSEILRIPARIEQMPRVAAWLIVLCQYWVDRQQAKRLLQQLEDVYTHAQNGGYQWLAAEVGTLLERLDPKPKKKRSPVTSPFPGYTALVDVVQVVEPWEMCLKALVGIQNPAATAQNQSAFRMVWLLNLNYGAKLEPREQKVNAKGEWTKGRSIALKRLAQSPEEFDYLTDQDRRLCQTIEAHTYASGYYYGKTEYEFNSGAIAKLIGHPLVFWDDNPEVRVDVVAGEPELVVTENDNATLSLRLNPAIKGDADHTVVKETLTRVKVITIRDDHRRIASILGSSNELIVPLHAKERVLEAMRAISSLVTIQSDIGGGHEDIEAVPAVSIPHLQLLPAGEGLMVKLLSRPFGDMGPYYQPGAGGAVVIAEIEGVRRQTQRNLIAEKSEAKQAIAASAILSSVEPEQGEWRLEDPEDCLELLLELQSLDVPVVIEWPEGEKLRLTQAFSMKEFRLNLGQQRDWFALEGELQIDPERVLSMKALLELLNQTQSRFLPLGDGQFLTLTESFRKRLDELKAYGEEHGNGVRLHPLAALALEEFVEEAGALKADKHWKAHVKKLKDMRAFAPQLPSTLQADLRDYQVEGFRWLARLAHWGVGACLADDMGLGKTLQALALILTRAPQGPTLVIAPTSVGMNWLTEASRFAPTLNPIQLRSGDRQKILDELQPFDLLVCSYGLLQQPKVAQQLAAVAWETIVLDEAQAIKNATTQRSKAAMKLQGKFKLLTTGTPIENHLGELWNLFRFINPGLLSSQEQFNQKFAIPIERYQDQSARVRLKTLVQPFMLRRTKNQVLSELPSRTEITLYVDLSDEERALYEALRQDAIAKLQDPDPADGAQHLRVLAEIMRLRRCCCNPQLAMPDQGVAIASSKLELFGEVLTELLENKHKALVFSQFVDHLTIIREYLNKQKISYQYLDGSTPEKQRKQRVDAFQAGEGDVFLISLKAGGTGLNLTAADYVIHMDPWWNPAVEDQASDRAHRIGQQRPVTIYRLVTRQTIEEQIVDLHQHKRDLADGLLEGADMSGKISTEELLRLIQV